MNVLIVYAHPNPASFNHGVLEHIQRGLKDGNHDVHVIDLYEEKFNPVLYFDASRKRRDMVHDAETEGYRKLIQWADHLIFIYPVWWYGPPAILKGFFDRAFVSGFAYTYEGNIPKGLLGGKSAWGIYTLDSPGWYVRLVRQSVEWKGIKKAILNFCGIRKVRRMMLPGLKSTSPEARKKWLDYLYHQARYQLGR